MPNIYSGLVREFPLSPLTDKESMKLFEKGIKKENRVNFFSIESMKEF
jgi:hypothetical protein